ncbi:MAG: FAD-dependent oxidoreductase [Lachnospiraceae bacterium]|nr:FAD-dependent oxidoreductase [Lachnospiraceae bacterium]
MRNIVVLGGVAAGTKTAAKLKRESGNASVTIYTKGKDISYAGCGLPYYVGGAIEDRADLIVNTPEKYTGLTGVQVRTGMEAVSVNPEAKTVSFANGETASYDSLVIAAGAVPFVPNVPGTSLAGVFTMREPDDAIGLRDYVEQNSCKSAVVVGAGFIGLEIAENLMAKGLKVTVVDMASQVLPNLFDPEMAQYIRRQLMNRGLRIVTGAALTEVSGQARASGIRTSAGSFEGDVVVLAIGIRPATAFLEGSGIERNRGLIVVDEYQRTNLDDIYAVGDCAQVCNRLTKKPQWSAMGSTANITGRLLAKNLGHNSSAASYSGCLGTGVVKLASDLNAGRTGLTEEQTKNAGYEVITATCVTDDKAHYYPDAATFVTKLVADKTTHALLGIQVLGAGAVDKMVDIAVTGIAMNARIEDFDTLDFAYAPPFSTAIHPFVQACYILENKLSGTYETFTPAEYLAGRAKGYRVLDVSPAPSIPGAKWIDLASVTTLSAHTECASCAADPAAEQGANDAEPTADANIESDADGAEPAAGADTEPYANGAESTVGADAEPCADSAESTVGADAEPCADSAEFTANADTDKGVNAGGIDALDGIQKDEKLLLVCAKGKRAYFLQNRLKALGYTNTRALEGGLFVNDVKVEIKGTLPAEEIKRVKGLGCLQDKRYPDVFNVRVITRNGRITAEEHRAIAEAAEKFGSGAITMTTRLTLEIQGVNYQNLQPLMDYLNERGLSTGGTGSLVRPVVSCKGTTCQYGLIDTFALSEKLHTRFYEGYHSVTLPHKFKIAVGGCPNNCVKPNLNDLGIVGQRVPTVDHAKCHGCKKCQVELACPIKAAQVIDGKIQIPSDTCNNCGRCLGKCPFGALEYQDGYRIYIGGRWGKKTAHGIPLTRIFTTEEEVLDTVEKAILLFRDEGITGERFADTVARLGFDYVNEKLLNNAITQSDREIILRKTVKGGATC